MNFSKLIHSKENTSCLNTELKKVKRQIIELNFSTTISQKIQL